MFFFKTSVLFLNTDAHSVTCNAGSVALTEISTSNYKYKRVHRLITFQLSFSSRIMFSFIQTLQHLNEGVVENRRSTQISCKTFKGLISVLLFSFIHI